MSEHIPSFEEYTRLVTKLKGKTETTLLPPAWTDIVDSVTKVQWDLTELAVPKSLTSAESVKSFKSDYEEIKAEICAVLQGMVGEHEDPKRTFRKQFSRFAWKLRDIARPDTTFTTPENWRSDHGIDSLKDVVENIKKNDEDRYKAEGLAAFGSGLRALSNAEYLHKISNLDQLVVVLEELEGNKLSLTFKGYILSLLDLVSCEHYLHLGTFCLNMFHYIWCQSWSVFLDKKAELLKKYPFRLQIDQRDAPNPQLIDFLSPITKKLWISNAAGMVEARFRLVNAMRMLHLPRWPRLTEAHQGPPPSPGDGPQQFELF